MAGLPVAVSRRVGNAPEAVVEGENGFLFDTADEVNLVAVIQHALDIPIQQRLEMGRRSAEIRASDSTDNLSANGFFGICWLYRLPHPASTNGTLS